ncbi:MAG: prepilin-type N-terminal cleavage/methylation domain-containing protein [Proteobacteria bacterium]|jgi:prepilin-type N-terminal cleavage/methylation domain-containing protein|nr:prepilin-type N-terminal cleavage/methylation domain-containing protein [Pseudomonadota bacterium]
MMKRNGFTLVEILFAIGITGILAAIGAASFTGLVQKYNINNQTKKMYTDIMTARAMAAMKNRAHFVSLSANQYSIYDDTNTSPNGNGTLETSSDTLILQKTLDKAITWNGSTATMEFNVRGLCNTLMTICIYSTVTPEYDCIKASRTRITLGKLTTQGTCSESNCATK